jgi:hypothetical protein
VEIISQCPVSYGKLVKMRKGSDFLKLYRDRSVNVRKVVDMSDEELEEKIVVGKLQEKNRITFARTDPLSTYLFYPDIAWDARNDRILIGYQGNGIIYSYDSRVMGKAIINYSFEAIKVKSEDKDKILNKYQVVAANGKRETPKFIKEKIKVAKKRPLFGRILIDPESNILVFPYKEKLIENYEYFEVFDETGNFIKKVKLLPKIKVPLKIIFKSYDNIAFLTLNEDEELTIVVYQIINQ